MTRQVGKASLGRVAVGRLWGSTKGGGRRALLCALAFGTSTFGATALAQQPGAPTDRGLEIAVGVGYAIPAGHGAMTPDGGFYELPGIVPGLIPLVLDAGYRFGQRFYLGLSFQYGFGRPNPDASCGGSESCSTRDTRVDLNLRYRPWRDRPINPWVGIGVGYEWLAIDVEGTQSSESKATGYELANLQLGGDIQGTPNLGFGPFLSVSFDQFQSLTVSGPGYLYPLYVTSKEIHEWIMFGVRGVFDAWM